MSKYLPLHLKNSSLWKKQGKAFWYRVYVNIFAIFLRIPMIPLSYHNGILWFYYYGDEIGYILNWRKKNKKKFISLLASGTGEFGDAQFNSLKEINEFWNEFEVAIEKKHNEIQNFQW